MYQSCLISRLFWWKLFLMLNIFNTPIPSSAWALNHQLSNQVKFVLMTNFIDWFIILFLYLFHMPRYVNISNVNIKHYFIIEALDGLNRLSNQLQINPFFFFQWSDLYRRRKKKKQKYSDFFFFSGLMRHCFFRLLSLKVLS